MQPKIQNGTDANSPDSIVYSHFTDVQTGVGEVITRDTQEDALMRLPGRKLLLGAIVGVLMAAVVGGGAVAATAKRGAARDSASTALVVGLGDSVGSGEGNPEVPKHGEEPAEWQNRRCHRSNHSFEAKVADLLKRRSPVKFIYLACSGATILSGLLGPYAGIAPERGAADIPAQVTQAKQLAGKETPDAVMISIGANDVHFGNVASFCAMSELYIFGRHGYCPGEIYLDGLTLEKWMERELEHRLPKLYDDLADALKRWVPAHRVFLAEYPDLVSESKEKRCPSIVFRPGFIYGRYEVNKREVEWLYEHFYVPLNKEIRRAALEHHWNAVAPPPEFENHGYCTGKKTWIRTYEESVTRQGDTSGTLHPNEMGHTAMANAFYPFVSNALALARRPVSAPLPPPAAPPVTG